MMTEISNTIDQTQLNQNTTPNTDLQPGAAGNQQPPAPPVIPATEPPKPDEDFAKRFSALTRKEREVLNREEKIRDDIRSINEYKKSQDLIKTNPLEFLKQHGWEFNRLAEFALNDGKPTPNDEILELRRRLDEFEKGEQSKIQSAKQEEQQRNVDNFKAGLKKQISEKGDIYELVNQYEQYDMVYDIMNDHFMKTMGPNGEPGQLLDIDNVASEVEKYIEGQLELASKTKKFASRYTTVTQQQQTEHLKSGETEIRSPSTLTNQNSTGSGTEEKMNTYLDDEASRRRSAKILEEHWAKKAQK